MARMTCGLAILTPALTLAQDRAELERARILGNRELPKVTYIVPWKKPLPDQLSGKPLASVLDEVLAPIDRDVHRRQVAYHALISTPGLAPLVGNPAKPAGAVPNSSPSPSLLSHPPPSPPSSPAINPPSPEKKP